jgi:hypothetical protein
MWSDLKNLSLAMLLGGVLTLASVLALNLWFDGALKDTLKGEPGLEQLADQFLLYVAAPQAEMYDGAGRPMEVPGREALVLGLEDTVLYGAPGRHGLWDAPAVTWLPWVPILVDDAVKPTLGDVDAALTAGCGLLASAAGVEPAVAEGCATKRVDDGSPRGFDQLWKRWAVPHLAALLEKAQSQRSYQFRRYLNGVIQGSTLWLTWTALVFMGLVWVPGVRAELTALERPARHGQAEPHVYQNGSRGALPDKKWRVLPDRDSRHYLDWLSALRTSTRGRIGSVDLLHRTMDAFRKSRTVDSAERAAEARFQELKDELESRLEPVRYLAWAVPSIGFVGTVLGIGSAMLTADEIISAGSDSHAQESAIQVVTGHLGTAFDTTLVALLCSLLLSTLKGRPHEVGGRLTGGHAGSLRSWRKPSWRFPVSPRIASCRTAQRPPRGRCSRCTSKGRSAFSRERSTRPTSSSSPRATRASAPSRIGWRRSNGTPAGRSASSTSPRWASPSTCGFEGSRR